MGLLGSDELFGGLNWSVGSVWFVVLFCCFCPDVGSVVTVHHSGDTYPTDLPATRSSLNAISLRICSTSFPTLSSAVLRKTSLWSALVRF